MKLSQTIFVCRHKNHDIKVKELNILGLNYRKKMTKRQGNEKKKS